MFCNVAALHNSKAFEKSDVSLSGRALDCESRGAQVRILLSGLNKTLPLQYELDKCLDYVFNKKWMHTSLMKFEWSLQTRQRPEAQGRLRVRLPSKAQNLRRQLSWQSNERKIYSVVKGVNSNVECLRKTMCRQFDSVSPHHQPGKVKKETHSKFNDF